MTTTLPIASRNRGPAVDYDDPLYREHMRRMAELQMTDAPVVEAEPETAGPDTQDRTVQACA